MGANWKTMPRVMIEVEPDLIDLIPDFLARKRADLLTIKSALDGAAGDLTMIAALAHKMKGEGGSFGFDVMSEIGGALEATAKKGDRDSVRQLVSDLSDYLEKVEIVEGPQT